jgi:hypothetical protein
MESDRISTIEDWPTPESVRDVQVLLGFATFFRRSIRKYAKVTAPMDQPCYRHRAHGSGNGLGMPNSHFESSKRPLPKH